MRASETRRPSLAAAGWLAILGPGFFLVYGACNAFTATRPNVGSCFFAWERHIPFVPVMILPYMSIDLFFAGSFFLCRSRGELRVHAWRVALAFALSAAGFLCFPLRYGWPRPAVAGWLGAVFAPLNGFDQPYNLCPSLHISLRALLCQALVREKVAPEPEAGLQREAPPCPPRPLDPQTLWLIGGVFGFLALASGVGFVLARRAGAPGTTDAARATISNLNARLRAWWVIISVCAAALLLGPIGASVLFGLASFWALREFLTLTPTSPGDHRALFWVFFFITPWQYYLVATRWYGMFVILIPVYAFLFIPMRMALTGDCENFLERAARTQWGLMVCVYCVSYAPALMTLPVGGNGGARLLLFFLLVVQSSDVLQYIWGKLCGRRPIAPRVSPNKTWEGFLGGIGSATALGTALWWATPFNPWQAAGMSLVITLLGFAGGLTMSAIKRDRGVKDYGTLIQGHGGVLDRVDSICFAAPVFFHLTRYCFTP